MAGVPALAAALAAIVAGACLAEGCSGRGARQAEQSATSAPGHQGAGPGARAGAIRTPRPALAALTEGEVYVYDPKKPTATRVSEAQARADGRLVVDLSDGWAPFILQDGGGAGGGVPGDVARPNAYRQTFIDLANDRVNPDGRPVDAAAGEHNFLEPFGIPPTLSVLGARVEREAAPARQACQARVDVQGLRAFKGNVAYQDREHARRAYAEAARDGQWLDREIGLREAAVTPPAPWKHGDRAAALAALRADSNLKTRTRVERTLEGQARQRAVRAAQARLMCEGLLSERSRFTPGMFDLPTHEALSEWERENDIFGWASLGGETLAALLRPPMDLHLETLRRIVAERVADAAGIVEDGSTSKWKDSPTYLDPGAAGGQTRNEAAGARPAAADGEGGTDDRRTADRPADAGGRSVGVRLPVRNLIEEHVAALLDSVHVATAEDMVDFLRQQAAGGWSTMRVAFVPPPLPSYYGPRMDLSVEIDRGDVWYDFPFDARGRLVEQPRDHFPHLTLFVHWEGQKIPLCWWRTTIGSWRSELHANGKIYYKYKNSDVGPRVWKNIVAGPVWIPPDVTPAKDLLTRKLLDREKGPELVVNTDIMGPGFQSAYGLVMAIHIDPSGFDNQIRTHGSVDYTSIARRFSHGCHRLVNNRAVRLFDFVLRRRPFRRIGSVPLSVKRTLLVDGRSYPFELKTRGYYYELERPVPVTVTEGRIMGRIKAPIAAYVRKAGVDYRDVDARAPLAPGRAATQKATEGAAEESPAGEAPDPSTADTAASLHAPSEDPGAAIGP